MDSTVDKSGIAAPEEIAQPAPSSRRLPGERRGWRVGVRTFVRIANVRLRFVFLMIVVGLVAGYWDHLMNYLDRWQRPVRLVSAAQARGAEYFCPMDPSIIRDQPANCPTCGMPLSKRAKSAGPAAMLDGVLAQVQLTPLKVKLGRIETSPVEYRLLTREVRVVGQIVTTDAQRVLVSARIRGRVDKLLADTGQRIHKGDPLAEMRGPEILGARQDLLNAAQVCRDAKVPDSQEVRAARSQLQIARSRLLGWGMSDRQVEEIIQRGTPGDSLIFESPTGGTIIQRGVLVGQEVVPGYSLFTVADLSRVWVQAKIFESDLAGVRQGQPVAVTSRAYPHETFVGRIALLGYSVDAETDTVEILVEVDNPESKLMPGMNVDATVRLPVGQIVELPSAEPGLASRPAATSSRPAMASSQPGAEHPPHGSPPDSDGRFVQGYLSWICPERLYEEADECPRDSLPVKLVKAERVVSVPESAVIDTGKRQVVYRESSPGSTLYELVEVKLGVRAGEFYPVLSGLTPGDRVVTRGAFAVDAENRLNPAAAAQYFGASGGPSATGSHQP